MKLYLLKYKEYLEHSWECLKGVVVRAKNEEEARKLVQKKASSFENKEHPDETPWLDPKYTSCKQIFDKGEPEIIIRDILEG